MTQKKSSQVRTSQVTGRFVKESYAKSRPSSTARERVQVSTLKGERLPSRDAKTGSFTTERSTNAIKSNVDTFTPALERLAKK